MNKKTTTKLTTENFQHEINMGQNYRNVSYCGTLAGIQIASHDYIMYFFKAVTKYNLLV